MKILKIKSKQKYSIFVRDLDKGIITCVNPAGELLWSQGLYQGSRPNVSKKSSKCKSDV